MDYCDNYPDGLSPWDLRQIEGDDDIYDLSDFEEQRKRDYVRDCLKYGEDF